MHTNLGHTDRQTKAAQIETVFNYTSPQIFGGMISIPFAIIIHFTYVLWASESYLQNTHYPFCKMPSRQLH